MFHTLEKVWKTSVLIYKFQDFCLINTKYSIQDFDYFHIYSKYSGPSYFLYKSISIQLTKIVHLEKFKYIVHLFLYMYVQDPLAKIQIWNSTA